MNGANADKMPPEVAVQDHAERRPMGIRARLILTFSFFAILVTVFAGVAIVQEISMAKSAAKIEAENLAVTLADSETVAMIDNPALLQRRLKELVHSERDEGSGRDMTIIGRDKIIRADAEEVEIGRAYTADQSGAVEQTLQDGISRSFVEPGEFYHGFPLKMIVIPIHEKQSDPGSPIVGAVLMEYTPIYERLMTLIQPMIYLTVVVGGILIVLVFVMARRMSATISRPLKNLEIGVREFAAGNYDARVAIQADDEIGAIALAFNRMAADLQSAHSRLIEHERELEERIDQRVHQIEHMAYHDSLTSLPNRSMFSKLLNQNISQAERRGKRFAVMFLDLDRFKSINDTLGHEAGDQLLQEASARIKQCLRDSDIVARLGGDEFVVLLPEYDDEEDGRARVEAVARKLLAAIAAPFAMLKQEFRVTASIGISTYPGDGTDEISLTKHADIAMYQAKDSGKNNFQFYSRQLHMKSFERLALESSLRRALERDEFQLHYQAKIGLPSGEISGMEALLRWSHPDMGMVSPVQFIPVAEETGLIVPIGMWVLRTASAQNVAWHKSGLPRLPVSVNLSARQFGDDHLLENITNVLREAGMSPHYLELEVTESMIMLDVPKAVKVLAALRKMGVRIAIDDFGTGYSSLSTLEKFPIDTIKVDRSFIRDLPENTGNKAITEAVITMGKNLGMTVVAEGVETQDQLEFLRDHACDQLQGYYFNKPMPADMFAEFVRSRLAMHSETQERKKNIA